MEETYVPGMGYNPYQASNELKEEGVIKTQVQMPKIKLSETQKPVVGFLYSMSRNGIPEFWPIYVGRNVIGRDTSCEVQLKEASVSGKHVALNVKKMKSTGKFIASIQDIGGGSGLSLNDEELDYEIHTCKNEDVITVGNVYKLVFILIDPVKYGLESNQEFISVEDSSSFGDHTEIEDTKHQFVQINPYNSNLNETVDLSGANKIIPGKTMILDK